MKRIGVYVCHCGGNISEVVDVKKVAETAKEQGEVVLVRDHEHMCSETGQNLVIADVKEHKLDKVVIAACSPQFQGPTFKATLEKAGLSPYVLEMANIREHCAWPHFHSPDEATEKAKGLTNIAIAKARLDEPLTKKKFPIGKRVLVVGGGIAGIQTSLDLGDAGFDVSLVEKNPSIGGKMLQLSRTFPTEDCAACILSPKMADVTSNENIHLYSYTEVKDINGYLGNYEVTLEKKATYVDPDKCTSCGLCANVCPIKVPNEVDEGLSERKAIYLASPIAVPHSYLIDDNVCIKCGRCVKVCDPKAIDLESSGEQEKLTVDTVVVATGFDIFDAHRKAVYGYGRFENVITSLELERMIVHSAEGNPLRPMGKRIAFIQCVGSRDEQVGNEYCSRICCMYATKLSQLIKRSDPSRDVYVFYTDLRAYGKGFEEYYKRGQNEGVKFVRGRPAELIEDPETKKVILRVEDTLTRSLIESEFDLVVLSVGLEPNKGTEKVADMLRLAKSPDGFLQEAHPKFRPVDTLTDGVFLAGTVQGPKDIPDTVAQASAAAARAIRLMNKGEYDVDPVMAFIHTDTCDGCGLCVEHCPMHAISIVDRKTDEGKGSSPQIAEINEAMCKGCGSCTAYCPQDALDLHCYTTDQLLAEVEAAMADKKVGDYRVLVFADDMTAYRLADNVGTAKKAYSLDSRIIRVPSGSRITPKLMLQAFSLGADGILFGESEQKSNPYSHSVATIQENVSKVQEILEEYGVEKDRVRLVQFVTVMLTGFVDNINALSDFVRNLGPVPEDVKEKLGKTIDEKLFG